MTIRELISEIPFLNRLKIKASRLLRRTPAFTSSGEYWETRYRRGGTSGAGSYHDLAAFKGEVINAFIAEHRVERVIEFGCGDGNQLGYFQVKSYTGFDVSPTAVSLCSGRYRSDPSRQFRLMGSYAGERAELTLSLDVIYHLTEDDGYHAYMQTLFSASESWVIIYSSLPEVPETGGTEPHIRHRRFSDWISENAPEFTLIRHIPNKYPFNGDETGTSVAEFFIYRKRR